MDNNHKIDNIKCPNFGIPAKATIFSERYLTPEGSKKTPERKVDWSVCTCSKES